MTMPSPQETPPSLAPIPRRTTFHVHLNTNTPAEINFKQLMIQNSSQSELPTPDNSFSNTTSNSLPLTKKPELTAPTTRPQRFNIIEHLEKRYGGGSVLNDGDGSDVGGTFDRRDDDDLYDSEDSFIDDVELQQNIEDVRDQVKVKTKHSGFFVSAGDEIETLEKEGEEETGGKSKRDVVSDWQPDKEVVKRLEVLRTAVQELSETTPIPKVFPRSLDEPLRAVDKLVVEAHPNKWRVTGYFAILMAFLPYTKQYLKSNMLRLEARDVARNKKEKMDSALETLTQLIAVYGVRAAAEPADKVKEDIAKDKELGTMLHALLELQDEWVSKENDYRQMLKTEDKKHMTEPDFKPLNQRQERNRMYNRVVALFTPGLTDLQTLRALNKAAKAKTPKKPEPVKGAATAAKKKSGEPTVGANVSVKRSIKPFKSRMMDEVPPFVEADFEDVEQ